MTTPESAQYIDIASLYVRERKDSEHQFAKDRSPLLPEGEVYRILNHLVWQIPNRVYSSGDGRLGRAILFREDQSYSAYMHIIDPTPSGLRDKPTDYSITESPDLAVVENAISSWRQRFDLNMDALVQPSRTYELETNRFANVLLLNSRTLSFRYDATPGHPLFFHDWKLEPNGDQSGINKFSDQIQAAPPQILGVHTRPFRA